MVSNPRQQYKNTPGVAISSQPNHASPKTQAITNSSSIHVNRDHFAHATVPAMHKETEETNSKSFQTHGSANF
ncbi:hypothetical protein C1H46_003972 [Malus baccata]|uniref:Uncharacterized protein n=1 Tax=Malus baccata TaxID=106549 RepID=A0A540NH57_MALBA|nr:hypothetical protein C1H46_003972 [Malus baccata]